MKKLLVAFALFTGIFSSAYSQCSTPVLESFGSISAIAIYNTYITIGSVADSYVGEVYESDYVITLMSEQKGMIEVVSESLNACIKDNSAGKLSEEDKEYLQQMIKCLEYLGDEADGLLEYAETNSEDALDKYSVGRDNAWELISELLGIE